MGLGEAAATGGATEQVRTPGVESEGGRQTAHEKSRWDHEVGAQAFLHVKGSEARAETGEALRLALELMHVELEGTDKQRKREP